jgi:hypothetical protein
VYCGAAIPGLPQDFAYQWPDRVFALPPEERAERTWRSGENNPDFVVLDGAAFFCRALLPIPIGEGEEFRYGVWLEVSQADFERILEAWHDEEAYRTLRFRAALANALAPWGDRTLGAAVDVATRDAGARPWVTGADDAWLAALLHAGWDRPAYERFARSLG